MLRRPWLWALLGVLLLFLAALVVLPYGIAAGLKTFLEDQGIEQAALDDVDFNPFTGTLVLRQLAVRTDDRETLVVPRATVHVAILPLFRKTFIIERLTITGAELRVERLASGAWRVGGITAREKPQPAAPEERPWSVAVGDIEIIGSTIEYLAPDLRGEARIERAVVNGRFGDRADAASARIDANAVLADVTLSPRKNAKSALRLERLRVEDVVAEGEKTIKIGRLDLERLAFGKIAKPQGDEAARDTDRLFAIERIAVRGVSINAMSAAQIEAVEMNGARFLLHRNERGRFAELDALRRLFPVAGEKTGARKKFDVAVGRVALSGSNELIIRDDAVKPAFALTLGAVKGNLSAVDSAKPDQTSRLQLDAQPGKYARVSFVADFKPFSLASAARIDGDIQALDLPPFTSYMAEHMGYHIESGHLDSKIDLKIADGKLSGTHELRLRNLKVAPKDAERVKRMTTQLTMPLDSALSMLRDGKGNIRLEVAIEGDIRDPKFDVTDALYQALTKALRTGAVGYLKHYFQPYGTLITVIQLAGKVLQLRLDPIFFAPGAAALDSDALAYLKRVVTLLKEREKLSVSVCGKAIAGDAPEADARAALAQKRADVVKEYLVKLGGIAADRMFVCRPELDEGKDARPRAELLL